MEVRVQVVQIIIMDTLILDQVIPVQVILDQVQVVHHYHIQMRKVQQTVQFPNQATMLEKDIILMDTGISQFTTKMEMRQTPFLLAIHPAEPEEDKKIILESYARLWKKLISDTYAKELLEDDVHSPAGVRVNAVVACFDEYYTIYDVKEGDDMYVAPEDRVKRW